MSPHAINGAIFLSSSEYSNICVVVCFPISAPSKNSSVDLVRSNVGFQPGRGLYPRHTIKASSDVPLLDLGLAHITLSNK